MDDGMFAAPDEAVGAALDLLRERTQSSPANVERLNQKIDMGMSQLARGEVVDAEEAFAELHEQGRRRREGVSCEQPSSPTRPATT